MKYQYFFIVLTLIAILMVESICKTVFHVNVFELLDWWFGNGEDRGLGFFCAGVGGLAFLGMLSYRCQNIYTAATAKPEYYAFLGDHMKKGFYGYKEKDETKTRIFIKSFMDRTVYPSGSLREIYKRQTILRDPSGLLTKFTFLNTANLIIWGFAGLAIFMFAICGLMVIFKNCAMHFRVSGITKEQIHQPGIGTIFTAVNVQTHSLLTILIFSVIGFYALSVIIIKILTNRIDNKVVFTESLPDHIKEGMHLEGIIIDSENFSYERSNTDFDNTRQSRTKFYTRYLIEFSDNFSAPVVLNFELKKNEHASLILKMDTAMKEKKNITVVLNEELGIKTALL